MTHTYEDIATNWNLWTEHVDPDGEMSREEFDESAVEEKVQILNDCFGPEMQYCAYCDAQTNVLTVPAPGDDAGWAEEATRHFPGCEWVETRAHWVQ